MPAYFRATLADFVNISDSEIVGRLTREHARQGYQQQLRDATEAWFDTILRLKGVANELMQREDHTAKWNLLLEFVIPRKGKRIDAVILADTTIILLELKSGHIGREELLQIEEYALLLHYFHQPSSQRIILPIVISNGIAATHPKMLRQQELALVETAAYWIRPAIIAGWEDAAEAVLTCESSLANDRIDAIAWDKGEYFPVPSIIDAARSLQAGLAIREIAHSRAAEHDVAELSQFIYKQVEQAKRESEHLICFVTGVPGSGKTLVGLNLAFQSRGDGDALHFMSGNGPLVMVMQALFKDYQQKVQGLRSLDASIQAKTLIEDVHLFAKNYASNTDTPSNHVVIFDEAQRAWDYEQSKRKFKRETSEPTMFLRIMGRHSDWAVIVALVGGGQEINSGKAGLAEWGRALLESNTKWRVIASEEVLGGGISVAGTSLRDDPAVAARLQVNREPKLHLKVSVRTLQAEKYAQWVNEVIAGNAEAASKLLTGGFPVYLTRKISELRRRLIQQQVGLSRTGLVGSSKAARLRANGLEPDGSFHGDYKWDKWYLAPATDVRSSDRLEVFATEFEIQGLELDWIGLCWGGDMIWSPEANTWHTRKIIHRHMTKWSKPHQGKDREYRLNSYRVLLTRARQGIIIYVPEGDSGDPTQDPSELEATAKFLISCGVRPLDATHEDVDSVISSARVFI